MLLINSILLSLFVFCAPKTLLVETEGEGVAKNENPDENIARIANAVQVTICLLVSTSVY